MSTSPSSLASASSKDDVSSSGVSSSAISSGSHNGCGGTDELHQWNGGEDDDGEDGDSMMMTMGENNTVVDSTRCSPIMLGSEATGGLTMLSSLDCWDYTIELECLRGGPEGYYSLLFCI